MEADSCSSVPCANTIAKPLYTRVRERSGSDIDQNSRFQVEIDVTIAGKVRSNVLNNANILTSARTLQVMLRIGEKDKSAQTKLTRTRVSSKESDGDIVPGFTCVNNISLRRVGEVIDIASSRSNNRECLLEGHEQKNVSQMQRRTP